MFAERMKTVNEVHMETKDTISYKTADTFVQSNTKNDKQEENKEYGDIIDRK